MKRILFAALLAFCSFASQAQKSEPENNTQVKPVIKSEHSPVIQPVNFNPEGEKAMKSLPYYQYKGIRDVEEARILWEKENPDVAQKYRESMNPKESTPYESKSYSRSTAK